MFKVILVGKITFHMETPTLPSLSNRERHVESSPLFSQGVLDGFVQAFQSINLEHLFSREGRIPESPWIPLDFTDTEDSLTQFQNDHLQMKVELSKESHEKYITLLNLKVEIKDDAGEVVRQTLQLHFAPNDKEVFTEGRMHSFRSKTYAARREGQVKQQPGKHYKNLAKSVMLLQHHEMRLLQQAFPQFLQGKEITSHIEDVSVNKWTSDIAKALGYKPEGGPLQTALTRVNKALDSRNPLYWVYTYPRTKS